MRNISLFLLSIAFLLAACKKSKPQPPPATSKVISTFIFQSRDNSSLSENVNGIMRNDSIIVKVKEGTPLNALIPTITHTGANVEPASGATQNFTGAVIYTVTAEDGSQTKYKVVVSYASSEKNIISFDIKSADNPGLTGDVIGHIQGDTISILIPPSLSLENLKPAITHSGQTISPATNEARNFSLPVKYTVTAEDETTKEYIVMVSQDSMLYVGCTDGKLYALNAINGKIKWTYQTNGAIISSVVLYKGNIYFGSGDRYVYAVNAKTGSLTWQYRAIHPVSTSPTVKNDVLYISCSPDMVTTGYTFALDALTGNLKWKSPDIYYGPRSPTVGNDAVYVSNWGSRISALDINTGTVKWYFNVGISFERPALKDGILYGGGETSRFFALNASTGEVIWKSPEKFGGATIPVVLEGKLFISSTPAICLNAANGDTIWNSNQYSQSALGTPSYHNGVLYITSLSGQTLAVDASNGTVKWLFSESPTSVSDGYRPNTTVSYGTVYAPGSNNNFYALDIASGKVRWTFNPGSRIIGGACIIGANEKVFHAGNSGNREIN